MGILEIKRRFDGLVKLKGKMAAHLVGFGNFLQLRRCVRVGADRRAIVDKIDRAARCKPATVMGAFEIKYTPATIFGIM